MAVQRITGLASGIDYESMIKQLMKAEQAPVDKLKQQKQVFQWQEEIFRDINKSLSELKDAAFNMKLSSSYKVFNTTSSDNTVVTASGTNTAAEGTYKIVVKQLATTAEMASAGTVSPDLVSNAPVTVFDMTGKDFYVTVDGVQKHIAWIASEGGYTDINQLKDGLQAKIDNAFGANQVAVTVEGGNTIKFASADSTYKSSIVLSDGTTANALTDLHFDDYARSLITTDTQLKDLKFSDGAGGVRTLSFDTDGKLKFTINGRDFEVKNTDTLQTLFTTVNSDADADVSMGYDASKDMIYIRRKESGAGKDITFTDGAGSNFSTAVGLGATTPGENAIIDFTDNRGLFTAGIEKASNNFTIAGINVTLLKEEAVPTEKTITVSKDVNAVYDKIKAFVDKYNEVMSKVNTKLNENKDYDYQPLTDDQKEKMEDTEIEQWETKAKTGLVGSDIILEGVVRDLRYSMTNAVVGASANFDQLGEFGITTGGYRENGMLYIDESKLKQAISENPDEVMNFFSFNPPDLKGNTLSGVVDVEGKDFNLTINGSSQAITLSGSYDLSTSDGKIGLIKELNDKITEKFGYNQVIASLSSDNRIVLSSPGGYSFVVNSGTANDGLAALGFADGNNYDASQKGITAKIYDKLNLGIKKITDKAGYDGVTGYYDSSLIGEQIKKIEERITEANDRLTQIEDRYYRQFTAMETALNKMNSQSAWLSQQLGSSSS